MNIKADSKNKTESLFAKARDQDRSWADPNPTNTYEWRKKDINSLGNYKTSYLCTARFSIQQVKSKSIHPYVRR